MSVPEYRTTDLHLASFLYCRGIALLGCTRLRPKKYLFRFAASRELHALLRLYWSQAVTPVIPGILLDTPQHLKSRALERPTGATISLASGDFNYRNVGPADAPDSSNNPAT